MIQSFSTEHCFNANPQLRKTSCLVIALLLSSCAYTPWKSSIVPGNTPEEKVSHVVAAQSKKPEELPERKDVFVTREQAAYELIEQADEALATGRDTEADGLYDRVLAIQPANNRALAGKAAVISGREHTKQVDQARDLTEQGKVDQAQQKLHQILLENPGQIEAKDLQAELNSRKPSASIEPPKLVPPSEKLVTLELRDANIKMVFEALSRSTGINFILDKDIKPDTKATVFIKQARVEDAIDLVLSTNGLQKKPLSATTALVYPNTAAKVKDYQDLVIRSFYLVNANAKQVSTLLKTVLKTKDIYVDDRLNMLTMRDTPEAVRIAEKLVASNDLADPEVMLEMEVLEISRTRLQQLGIEYPTGLTVIAPSTGLTLQNLKDLGAGGIGVNGAPGIDFKKTTGDVNVLSNPRIRVRNNEKAKVLVGDKVPIITTVATAGVGSSQSVQYIDVGLKLEVEPRITLDDFVNIKIGLEVSSLGAATQITGGGVVYRIGTRNANTTLRLKDGETQVLAGLISEDERKNADKLPGLGDIPLLGRLFSDRTDQKSKTEIVLAITPHIINKIVRPQSEVVEYWSGTESSINDRPQIVVPGSAGVGSAGRNVRPGPPPEQDIAPAQDTQQNLQLDESQKAAPVQVDPLQYKNEPPKEIIDVPPAPLSN